MAGRKSKPNKPGFAINLGSIPDLSQPKSNQVKNSLVGKPANEFKNSNESMINLILTITLTVITAFMGVKQGLIMISPPHDVLQTYLEWGLGKSDMKVLGILTLASAILMVIPRTFFAGNLVMALVILVIISFQIQQKDIKSFAIEVPFFILNLILIYLQHPINSLKNR